MLTLLLLLTLTASENLRGPIVIDPAGYRAFHVKPLVVGARPLWRPPLTVRVDDISPRKRNIVPGRVLPSRQLVQSTLERTRRTRLLSCLTGGPETLDGILAALECKNDRNCRKRACQLQEGTP